MKATINLKQYIRSLMKPIIFMFFISSTLSCATYYYRANSNFNIDPVPIYPASLLDGYAAMSILGREGEYTTPKRVLYFLGAHLDFPISLSTDTILLPYDLLCLMTVKDNRFHQFGEDAGYFIKDPYSKPKRIKYYESQLNPTIDIEEVLNENVKYQEGADNTKYYEQRLNPKKTSKIKLWFKNLFN